VTAEERRRSNAQVLDASWGEKSFAVREEMRVSLGVLSLFMFWTSSLCGNKI